MIPVIKSTRIDKSNPWWYTWLQGREMDREGGDKHLRERGGILHLGWYRQNSRHLYILLFVSCIIILKLMKVGMFTSTDVVQIYIPQVGTLNYLVVNFL